MLSAIVILLIADFLWQAMKTAIDGKLAEAADAGQPNTEEARRRARLRRLLPICRNILFVVVAIGAMMALSALGVQIGPLVAGAGIIGIAIGFWLTNFARDVIAGMFYLMDDAFRIGEYIQAGRYRAPSKASAFVRSGCGITAARSSPCRSICWARSRT